MSTQCSHHRSASSVIWLPLVEDAPNTHPYAFGRPCFLLIQRDVTEQVELENLLSELTEDQLAMLSQVGEHSVHSLATGYLQAAL